MGTDRRLIKSIRLLQLLADFTEKLPRRWQFFV
jgi:hypothetical protein